MTVFRGLGGSDSLRDAPKNGCPLRLEVQTEIRRGQHQGIPRTQEDPRAALIDEWIGLEPVRRGGTAGLSYQENMVDVRRSIDPFVGTRQGRGEPFELDGLAVVVAAVQLERDLPQQRLAAFPPVGRALHARDAQKASQKTPSRVDHDERAIPRTLPQRA